MIWTKLYCLNSLFFTQVSYLVGFGYCATYTAILRTIDLILNLRQICCWVPCRLTFVPTRTSEYYNSRHVSRKHLASVCRDNLSESNDINDNTYPLVGLLALIHYTWKRCYIQSRVWANTKLHIILVRIRVAFSNIDTGSVMFYRNLFLHVRPFLVRVASAIVVCYPLQYCTFPSSAVRLSCTRCCVSRRHHSERIARIFNWAVKIWFDFTNLNSTSLHVGRTDRDWDEPRPQQLCSC